MAICGNSKELKYHYEKNKSVVETALKCFKLPFEFPLDI